MLKSDFLTLHYQGVDILFARDLFYASTYRKPCDDLNARGLSQVPFGASTIPDFDLDGFVKGLFPGVHGCPPLLGAVCQTGTIYGAHGPVITERPELLSGDDLFSLAIPSDSDVRSHRLSEFRPLPYHLRTGLDGHGIHAVRFEGTTIQYFCDARVFIPACIAMLPQRSD